MILTSAYWPNLHYFFYLLNTEKVIIWSGERFIKQSYRNRTHILSANGVIKLSIPLKHYGNYDKTSEIRISYSERWQQNHWRAIKSAYGKAPYFEFFEDELSTFYQMKEDSLVQYNLKQLHWVYRVLKKEINFDLSTENEPITPSNLQLIQNLHPKKEIIHESIKKCLTKTYYQSFPGKFPFIPNLSILDLLLNKGLESATYLNKAKDAII